MAGKSKASKQQKVSRDDMEEIPVTEHETENSVHEATQSLTTSKSTSERRWEEGKAKDETCDTKSSIPTVEEKAVMLAIQEDQTGEQDGEENQSELSIVDDEEEEQFDLVEILSCEKIQTNQVVCSGGDEGCDLLACSIWASSVTGKRWYYCVDCQKRDFDGWPEIKEIPISHMDREHKHLIAKNCSRKRNPAMPTFPSSPAAGGGVDDDAFSSRSKPKTNFVTPPRNSLATPKGNENDSSVLGANSKTALVKQITPHTGGGVSAAMAGKPTASASALATHKKWQEEAERLGSKDSRIIIDRKVAKKVIFDTLHDLFRPTNITDLYKNLKAVIPSPVLSACLHEMSMDETDCRFTDSDEEDADNEASKTAAKNKMAGKGNCSSGKDPFAGLLKFKTGKNSASNLWYVDYNRLTEMDSDERQKLAGHLAGAKAELDVLNSTLKRTREHRQRLLSEPTSDRLVSLLAESELTATELQINVENARKLRVNEIDKNAIKKDIARMAKSWRERRKVVVEFLVGLEENTDGQVTMKRSLAGDGPLALDCDEAVAKAAVSAIKDKRSRDINTGDAKGLQKRRKVGSNEPLSENNDISLADENFVAVLLNSQGSVERVYALQE